jgi:hypothetical protein
MDKVEKSSPTKLTMLSASATVLRTSKCTTMRY